MKKILLLLCILSVLIFAVACGEDSANIEKGGGNTLIFPNNEGATIETVPYSLPADEEQKPSVRNPVRRPHTLFQNDKAHNTDDTIKGYTTDIENGNHDRAAAAILFEGRAHPGNPYYLYKLPSSPV